MRLLGDPEALRCEVRSLEHRPALLRLEGSMQESHLRIGGQLLLQLLDHRLKLIAGRAPVGKHFQHFDFAGGYRGVLNGFDESVVRALVVLEGKGKRTGRQKERYCAEKAKEAASHGGLRSVAELEALCKRMPGRNAIDHRQASVIPQQPPKMTMKPTQLGWTRRSRQVSNPS
jgi:hypothetical protein